MAGLLLLFLMMEIVCSLGPGCHVALFSNKAPTLGTAHGRKGILGGRATAVGPHPMVKNNTRVPTDPPPHCWHKQCFDRYPLPLFRQQTKMDVQY